MSHRLRIAHIGFLSYIKGMSMLNQLTQDPAIPVDWYVIGDMEQNTMDWSNATITGQYNSFDELQDHVDYFDIDCIIMLSICPESFSYTLTEAWLMGLPVIGSLRGAIGRRIIDTGCGYVVDPVDYQSIKSLIMNIRQDDLSIMYDKIQDITLPSYDDMVQSYQLLYQSILYN